MYTSQEKDYGKLRMNTYIPTLRAKNYLSYFESVGWHDNNHLYYQKYEDFGGWFFIFSLAGKGIIKINDKPYVLLPGTTVAVPPYSRMEYYTDPVTNRWQLYWLTLFGTYAVQTGNYIFLNRDPVFRLGNLPECIEVLNAMLHIEDSNKFRYELTASRKIAELLGLMAQDLLYRGAEKEPDNYLMQIVAELEKNYDQPIQIEKVAEQFHISQNHLIRKFQSEIGYTPYEYLKNYRLLKACELIERTDRPIGEIGIMTGFSNISNFICQFKDIYGVTPNQYRKLLKKSILDR